MFEARVAADHEAANIAILLACLHCLHFPRHDYACRMCCLQAASVAISGTTAVEPCSGGWVHFITAHLCVKMLCQAPAGLLELSTCMAMSSLWHSSVQHSTMLCAFSASTPVHVVSVCRQAMSAAVSRTLGRQAVPPSFLVTCPQR